MKVLKKENNSSKYFRVKYVFATPTGDINKIPYTAQRAVSVFPVQKTTSYD